MIKLRRDQVHAVGEFVGVVSIGLAIETIASSLNDYSEDAFPKFRKQVAILKETYNEIVLETRERLIEDES
jgi:hypothetical protein